MIDAPMAADAHPGGNSGVSQEVDIPARISSVASLAIARYAILFEACNLGNMSKGAHLHDGKDTCR